MKSYLDPADPVFAELEKDSAEVRQILKTYQELRVKTNGIFIQEYSKKIADWKIEMEKAHSRIEEIKRTIENLQRNRFDEAINELQQDREERRKRIGVLKVDISGLEQEIARLSEGLPVLPDLDILFAKRKTAEDKLEVGWLQLGSAPKFPVQ